MSSIRKCDICKKTIENSAYHVRSEYDQYDYCDKCWIDRKNWPKIHKKVASV